MTNCQLGYFPQDDSTRLKFSAEFDRKPFLFRHGLESHHLLSTTALKELAEKMAVDEKPRGFLRLADESWDKKWGSAAFRKAVSEAFEGIEASKMRLKLSRVHVETAYAELLSDCREELSYLTSVDLEGVYKDALATIFISSPWEVTPCHLDLEANFLLQIRGTKTVYILDGNDRRVFKSPELEEFWHGQGWIAYREELRSMAWVFELEPGVGVHNPTNFPHWVENGPTASVSLSLGFTRNRNPVDVLHVNYYLRKLGVSPTPPGEKPGLDAAKAALVRGARRMKRALRPG